MGQRLKRFFSRCRGIFGKNRADTRYGQTIPTPKDASVPGKNSQQAATISATTNIDSVHHEPPAGATLEFDAQSLPSQEAFQPVTSVVKPGFPGRLWTEAYDAIRNDDPRLVAAYEKIFLKELGNESDAKIGGENDQTDAGLTHNRFIQLVKVHLDNTYQKNLVNHKVQASVRIASSVREIVNTALKEAPEAATAWGGVCLLLKVS